jgi:uncharacterized membrane protein YccC
VQAGIWVRNTKNVEMEKLAAGSAFPPALRQPAVALRIQQVASLLWTEKGPLLFGLRLWASVCLALYAAFWLQLENPFWAGTSAAIVCLPSRGASLRKAPYRMAGTIIGAIFAVALSAAFPQDRLAFLLGLALWGAAATFCTTILRTYAGYAAALSGYTAAIIASDELGAVGGANGQVFLLAVDRATEIVIGIVAAGIVLAGTDFGSARRRLREQLAATLAAIGAGLIRAVYGETATASREVRRSLLRSASALYAVADEAAGESSEIRYRSAVLQDAVDGLLASIASWSVIANHLQQLPGDRAREDADSVLKLIPPELQKALGEDDAKIWIEDTSRLRLLSEEASTALYAMPADSPSSRLLADRAARTLDYLSLALNGVAFLGDPRGELRWPHRKQLRVPDFLPAFVNAVRAFLTIAAVTLFWIVTAWPGGAGALVIAAIGSILIAPSGDLAPASAVNFLLGIILTAVLAGILKFAVLPQLETFAGLSIALGLVLVPLGAMQAQPWRTGVFLGAVYTFFTFLSPTNEMIYDTSQFYNTSLATIAGMSAAVLALLLMPPLPTPLRARRLLALTLHDFRQLAVRTPVPGAERWIGKAAGRLSALPDQARLVQFTVLGTALSAGAELIRLRRLASRFGFSALLNPSLEAIARGQSQLAISGLAEAGAELSQPGNNQASADIRIEARAKISLLSEALSRHSAYFDGRALE